MSILPNATSFKRLVDGTDTRLLARAARVLLRVLSIPYGIAIYFRNRAYDLGVRQSFSCGAPVICVGNFSLGGTGKTPLVSWIARHLMALKRHPAIVSRGYGAQQGQQSDEAAELSLILSSVQHFAHRDRIVAARKAVKNGSDVVILDDGFQHRRLARDINIITVDATDPYGCGFLFPRGLLRESLREIRRADAIVLTRSTLVDESKRKDIRNTFQTLCSTKPLIWAEADHKPMRLRQFSGVDLPIHLLNGKKVVAFAGIGNPDAFHYSLTPLDANVVAFRPFPDHHAYSNDDVTSLGGWASQQNAELVITTLKDLVKIQQDELDGIPLVAVEIEIDFLVGQERIEKLIDDVVCLETTSSSSRCEACASANGVNTS